MKNTSPIAAQSAAHDMDRHIAGFRQYAEGFLTGQVEDDSNILLKRDHSLRVLAEARVILDGLTLNRDDRFLAELAALYHDLGRLPQYAQYRTFNDSISVNHGCIGARALETSGFLDGVERRELVIEAVRRHNAPVIPPGMELQAETLTRLVRDADKLDIIRVMLEHFQPDAPPNDVVTLGLRREPDKWSPEIVDAVVEGRVINYQHLVYINDFKLMLTSWINRLHFIPSKARWKELGYSEALIAVLPPDCAARLDGR